jgi:hypothetical protein
MTPVTLARERHRADRDDRFAGGIGAAEHGDDARPGRGERHPDELILPTRDLAGA